MEPKSSFESIQSLLSSHMRPRSQIVHSQLASEANYLHLLTSLQPPAKFPPDDELERSEGQRRAAGTVLLFALLEDASTGVKRTAWNQAKRVALFQGDNFAEYYSSVGSVGRLRDLETLQNCERALLRYISRRVSISFARWRQWTRWLHRESLGKLIYCTRKVLRDRLAVAFSRLRRKAESQRYMRERVLQRLSHFFLAAASHGFGGMQSAFSSWKLIAQSRSSAASLSLNAKLLKFKVKHSQNYETKVVTECIEAAVACREKVLLRFFHKWRCAKHGGRGERTDAHCQAGEQHWDEEKAVEEVKRALVNMTVDLIEGFQFL